MQIEELAKRVEELGAAILAVIRRAANDNTMGAVSGLTDSGDASFNVDRAAEKTALEWLRNCPVPLAAYTEDMGLISERANPEYVLVIDALDGSRAFKAGLETACVSIAAAHFRGKDETRFGDIVLGFLWETKSDATFASQAGRGAKIMRDGQALAPFPSAASRLEDIAWGFEVCGRPAEELFNIIGDLINASAVRGGCFLLNSTTFAISRIVLGRFDAYIDVGARIVEEAPSSVDRMHKAGQRQVLGLFPYDIAAAYLIAKEAGIVLTDAYGKVLDDRRLLGSGPETRLSCVAARNSLLHEQIMCYINARFVELLQRPNA
ncbi:MAG: hypothetical protein JW759_06595 [Candidatus Coatesbacteria bacterium]|nr:hypothetical protein [Candidatus Coatesbacteria bacterium]